MSDFSNDIALFNKMYRLPTPKFPTPKFHTPKFPTITSVPASLLERLANFKKILLEEISEIDDISAMITAPGRPVYEADVLTAIADFLGDVQVYCASEMLKYGLNNDAVLRIIMRSNFSKEGPNGPIYDERGKSPEGSELLQTGT